MPHVKLGTKDESGFELIESPDLIAVRTRSTRSVLRAGPVAQPESGAVADGQLVASFPEAGVEVYRVAPQTRDLESRKRALRAAPDVRFAGSVLVRKDSGRPVVYTENLYVRFREDVDPDECERIIREAGLAVKNAVDFAVNGYFVAAPEGTGQKVFEIALELLNRPEVIYCHPELIQQRASRQIFPEQWHLKPTTVGGTVINAHANVEAAHAITTGTGATIAIIDDGVDIDHIEFSGAGKIVSPRDATLQSSDPRPKSSREEHGTSCAGVACADGARGASGVAPGARLMPIRLASSLGSIREAEAFKWAADHGADIISCSWGPADGQWWNPNDPTHNEPVGLPASTRDAIDYATTMGRGGKGCVVFFAAGNGNESVTMDGYASYGKVIAVAACNDRGTRSVYSDYGPEIWCSFPSNDFGHPPFSHPDALTPGIWTTDRTGTAGYNSGNVRDGDTAGDFTNSFGGTSSACPGAAGVAALVIAANRSLTREEVKQILRKSCDRIDPQGGAYDQTAHSHQYGYGRLNAETAVKLAKSQVGRLVVVRKLLNEPIPDLGRVDGTIEVGDATPIEKVVAAVRLEHTYIGDLLITLIPPVNRGLKPSVLHNRSGGRTRNLDRQYDSSTTPGLKSYVGKDCSGTWTFRIEDRAAQDSGILNQIELQLSLPPANPTLPAPREIRKESARSPNRMSSKRKTKARS